jgi:hypothetical protein
MSLLEDIIEAIIENKLEWPREVQAPMSVVLRAYQTWNIVINDITITWRYEPNITIKWKTQTVVVETGNQF